MSKTMATLLMLLALPGLTVSNGFSGPNANAKIAAHLESHAGKGFLPCQDGPKPACNANESNLVVMGNILTGYDLYLLVLDGSDTDGIGAASLGVSYVQAPQSGIDVLTWTLCASSEFKGNSWPDSGSGNLVTWNPVDNCQIQAAGGDTDSGVTAIIGVMYVYAYEPDVFELTGRTFTPSHDFSVTSCGAIEDTLSYPQSAGKASFGVSGGYDPCQ